MFGENLILGNVEGKIDFKGRTSIPNFAEPESGDQIMIISTIYDGQNALQLFPYEKGIEVIAKYKKMIENAKSHEEYKKWNKELEEYCFNIKGVCKLDQQHRLLIPKQTVIKLGLIDPEQKNSSCIEYNGLGESLLLRKKNK